MGAKSFKTTKAHFKIFKEEVEYWIEQFGLRSWRWYILHEHRADDALAGYGADYEGCTVAVHLEPDWEDTEVTNERLRLSAFHEVCHVLLTNLVRAAEDRYVEKGRIDEEEHRIIRILENAVFK